MTNAINHYAKNIRLNADSVKAKNKAKADKLVMLVSDKRALAALVESNIDATLFASRAFYATEKCVKTVYCATREVASLDEISDNAFATIKTIILAHAAKVNVTKTDIEAALSSDVKLDATRVAHVYRRRVILSDMTLAAQSQQCVDMLRTLKLVKEVSRNVFEVQETKLFSIMQKQFAELTL